MNDHVALYEDLWPTPVIAGRQKEFGTAATEKENLKSWETALWEDAYWPTNACRITKDGREIVAPYTGSIGMAPYDTNYPVADFKKLSQELTSSIQAAFPDRTVRVISYYGEKQ